MDDPHSSSPQASDQKTVLPDVVHSQQIPTAAATETVSSQINAGQNVEGIAERQNIIEVSETESISEDIPSRLESISDSEQAAESHESKDMLRVETDQEKVSKNSSLNIPITYSASENQSVQDTNKLSTSWNLEVNPTSDVHHISEESPVNLALSSDGSKENAYDANKSQISQQESLENTEFLDSSNEQEGQSGHKTDDSSHLSINSGERDKSLEKESSESEEIIKLDIRGKGAPRIPLSSTKIIFGPPPAGSIVIEPNVEPLPTFQNLLSPFLVGLGDSIKLDDIIDNEPPQEITQYFKNVNIGDLSKNESSENPPHFVAGEVTPEQNICGDKIEQSDLLIEEVTVDHELKEKIDEMLPEDETSMPTHPKSIAPDETISFSTLTTDYKTICEEYHVKLVNMEAAITQRDELIEELTISLQRSVSEQEHLRHENDHLTNEVQNLQHIVGERSQSEHDTIKAHLSDFVKYQNMTKEDSTKFFSALMSGGSSLQSSNGEKDIDREEITVNYSKSDVKSSGSFDFQTGFEGKVNEVISDFNDSIEENLRNELRERLIRVVCEETSKIRMEYDAEMKELEHRMHQDRHAYAVETRQLKELLESVKSGDADVDALREQLKIIHEKDMANLRTYFEEKCRDMERSYSEEVMRGRLCASPAGSAGSAGSGGSAGSLEGVEPAPGADLPPHTLQSAPLDQAAKQPDNDPEQRLQRLRAEHAAHVASLQRRHGEAVAALQEQISQLKAHLQTAENTEASVSLYQQDIDLELEKDPRLRRRLDQVRQEVAHQLQDQIQVLLSDPDAELSSWPLELVALRDKMHGAHRQDDLPSLRDELSGGEADKWKQRRNHSFDQNRQLEEVTKERDGLKLVAAGLQRVVAQLAAYFAAAEDELNRTVLTQLLARLAAGAADSDTTFALDESALSCGAEGETEAGRERERERESSGATRTKHVHFAPELRDLRALAELDEGGLAALLREQRDLSLDIKHELDHSLQRLRHEAHELLQLSARLTHNRPSGLPELEDSKEIPITDLVHELQATRRSCDNCELHRKNMEEAMAECLQREGLLRGDLEAALGKIAQLVTGAERQRSTDLVAEGYGTGQPFQPLQQRARPLESGAVSLDGGVSPRQHLQRLAAELEALQRERDDLQQQLEAANRQLRSTRQFVEEQAAEREAERDEFAARLEDARDENSRLAARLHGNARILNEVEQLEAQTQEMNQLIIELESKKSAAEEESKVASEKILILRDIIANLEGQLEQKAAHELEILEQLEEMKKTIDERDRKMRSVLGELDSMRSERLEQSEVVCVKCSVEGDKAEELMEKVREQARWLEQRLHRRLQRLERAHEVCSAPCSEPSEDVSLRDQKHPPLEAQSPEADAPTHLVPELARVWESAAACARAEDAVLKRVADLEMQREQLKVVAQEVRAERDVLQTRMSEQALRVSSLSARLEQQRHHADALAQQATSHLTVQLHDALAQVQRLQDELESKDKHLARLKQNLEEKSKTDENGTYGNSCHPKDKVVILERELAAAAARSAQLEEAARALRADGDLLRRALRDKDEQMRHLMALNLDDENQKDDDQEIIEGAKTSARTLSDIVSISEFDEQDLQMRRAEIKSHNHDMTETPFRIEHNKAQLNRTVAPDLQRPNMSSLNLEHADHFDIPSYTPRADSLPNHLTSTQNKDLLKEYKRNMNETTMFGTIERFGETVKHSTTQKTIPDNCSMYPNRDASDGRTISVEPKKINFSLEPSISNDNKTQEEFTSLRELGITLDIKQENFPDILTQLKHEIKKSRSELENCKSDLKNAEEQLCEFPALKEEVEQLKTVLENTMATMETDKKFYENQLESFSSNKTLLEQRLTELTQEVNEKSKDLHLLKEDILRRENMILELAKEKRNLTNKLTELEVKIDELQSRNATLEKFESENHQMREKLSELQKLEQLVSEKNHQIDSLNQHLDRLDDLQRSLNDKTEELNNLKEAFKEKSNELFHMQKTVEALNRDIAKASEENEKLNTNNKELTIKLTKLEKDQENASLKLAHSEVELQKVNSINNELTSKINELKQLTDKLKDKETEIEILHEDINCFHEEIDNLKEQLKMVSRSPSPRSPKGEEKKSIDRQTSRDKKQLVKIRKQISLLQHELDFNKKELNDKAFELAKAKLDVTELRSNLTSCSQQLGERERGEGEAAARVAQLRRDADLLRGEKRQLEAQLQALADRIREESDVSELRGKLRERAERCQRLEAEVQRLKQLLHRERSPPLEECGALVLSGRGGARSPTAELERAVRDQLDYSHRLDEDIMDQILSASSDEREDIPRLALNSSKSSGSARSASPGPASASRLRADNEQLRVRCDGLEARLRDKDALIAELNRIRDKLVQDWQAARLRCEAERDAAGRLQLLLDTHRQTADSLQTQDSNMIGTLKKRLESSMQSELELQQAERQLRARVAQLERQLLAPADGAAATAPSPALQHQLDHERECNSRLRGEMSVVKARLEAERQRAGELQAQAERARTAHDRDLAASNQLAHQLREQLAEHKRVQHDNRVELLRARELLAAQAGSIAELERRLAAFGSPRKPSTEFINDALGEIREHKSELTRELVSLRQCIVQHRQQQQDAPELRALREERAALAARVARLEADAAAAPAPASPAPPLHDRDQAVRYLQGRCLRLESCRKALVWQKRYLQRVVAGYLELERALRPRNAEHAEPAEHSRGRKRFKCVALGVVCVLRMAFLVRRRQHVRALAGAALLRARDLPAHAHAPHTTPSGPRPRPSDAPAPCTPDPGPSPAPARRALRMSLPTPSAVGDYTRGSPCASEEPFILSSPRGEVAASYLNKLELVSRCLNQAMEAPRDVP